MKQNARRFKHPAYSFGNGFDFMMHPQRYPAFRSWWNSTSHFPTGAPAADAKDASGARDQRAA